MLSLSKPLDPKYEPDARWTCHPSEVGGYGLTPMPDLYLPQPLFNPNPSILLDIYDKNGLL